MLRNGHVRFGGRDGETDRRQRRHRAPSRPCEVMPRLRVAELALDDDQRHALARHLDRVRVAQLVRREASPHAGLAAAAAQLARGRRRLTTAVRASGR